MGVKLEEGSEALEKAAALAEGRFQAASIDQARGVIEHVGQRSRFGFETTVVALGGGTGAGKSSLFNAVLRGRYARAAATRPTTRSALAVSNRPATALLDYLQVPDRREEPAIEQVFDSLATRGRHARARTLVMLDLPDIDSDVAENREIAARLAQKVDVLIWVLDPQKYADAVIHESYLQEMTALSGSTLVVLNHIDELPPEARESVLADVRRLLAADGVRAEVVATSARTGEGVAVLQEQINKIVKSKAAMAERLAGDVRSAAAAILADVAAEGGEDPRRESKRGENAELDRLTDTLARAVGADKVAQAGADSYRLRGRKATSWPLLRFVRSVKVDPLKRLHLLDVKGKLPSATRAASGSDVDGAAAVTPVIATGVQVDTAARTAGQSAVTAYVKDSTHALPHSWSVHTRTAMDGAADEFFAGADGIFINAPVRLAPKPVWWSLMNLGQWLALGVAVAGGVWLLLWNFADMLGLVLPDPPAWGIFMLPTLMLGGGILLGWLLSLLSVPLVARGADRTRRRVVKGLSKAVAQRAQQVVAEPLAAELSRYREFYSALSLAASTHA